jgi:hypothetical protein
MTDSTPPPPRKRSRWFTMTVRGLLLLVVVVTVVIGVAVPRLRIARNEMLTIHSLGALSVGQARWQSACLVDQDGDGAGGFGFFHELSSCAGHRTPGGASAIPASHPFIWPGLGRPALTSQGIGIRRGYYFRIHLPAATGQAVPEPPEPISGNPGRWCMNPTPTASSPIPLLGISPPRPRPASPSPSSC